MERISHLFIKPCGRMAVAVAFVGITSTSLHAQTPGQDFFTNTQQVELRAMNPTDDRPGFNPCGTGGVVDTSGVFCSTDGGDGLLSGTNVIDRQAGADLTLGTTDDTFAPGLFTRLGPGAVTDNMFGIVQKPADPTTCAPTAGGTNQVEGTNKLNCGDVRFDLITQGQDINSNIDRNVPKNPNQDMVSSVLSSNTPVNFTSGTGETTHTASFENAFVWNPTENPVLLSTGKQCMGKNPTTMDARVCGDQTLTDTTALDADRVSKVSESASWNTGQAGGVGNPAMTNAQPLVTWSSLIEQGEVAGPSNPASVFRQDISGSFNYNDAIVGIFPSAQYPTGKSFTSQSGSTTLTPPLIP